MAASTTTLEENFNRKLEVVTAGLPKEYLGLLNRIPKVDAMTVIDYMVSLNAEVNPSENHRRDIIKCLSKFAVFCRSDRTLTPKTKNLKELDRNDVLAFLDSLRKSEIADHLHK